MQFYSKFGRDKIGSLLSICLIAIFQKPSNAFAQPSATEIFQLRTMCQSAAMKLAEERAMVGPYWSQDVASNVSQKTLHCYVQVTNSTADTTVPLDQFKSHTTLYDGQTGELLADFSSTGQDKRSGQVFDQYFQGASIGFDSAKDYVQKLMDPER